MFRCLSALGVATMLAAGPASAAVNLEYGLEYEEAYLELCKIEHSERACVCSMEALETRVGFEVFAEEISRHRAAFLDRSPLATAALDLIGSCTALGSLR
jgi:hypothetical protein